MPGVVVMGAAIIRHGRVLVARRTHPAPVAGGWEFPGGKVEPGEDPDAAVVREIREELGCEVAVIGRLEGESSVKANYVLRVAVAILVDGEPIPHEHDAVRWLGPEELGNVDWLRADLPFLPELRSLLFEGQRLHAVHPVTVRAVFDEEYDGWLDVERPGSQGISPPVVPPAPDLPQAPKRVKNSFRPE